MSKPLLSVENITLKPNDHQCFAGTQWCIHDDEQWALIGPTGAGKSLLVNALCRRVAILQGQILYFFDGVLSGRPYLQRGEIVVVSAEAQRELLQQHAGYHQARWQSMEGEGAPTVAELLSWQSIEYVSPYDTTHSTIDETAYARRRTQAVELLGIGHLLDRKITYLSNGEGRKVLLARALVQAPKLLILDDPFGGLDNASRQTLARVLTAILAEGKQRLLLVTSRQEEISEGITHVLGVAGCQVVMQDTKATVLSSSFARQVLGVNSQAIPSAPRLPAMNWQTLPPGTPLIELQHVNVKYHGATVLHDITWTMKQGEHWAVRGSNGAGKSTLLSLILGDNPQAYANDLKLFGRQRGSGESIWEIKRRIGWVAPELNFFYQSQNTCQMVVCSGFFDSIGLYREVTSIQAQTAATWMRAVGIESLAGRSFQAISIGEQRLVLLARALVKHPSLLVLDEPCQGLDAAHRAQIIRLLNTLCEQTPVSLLYVTHHADELPQAITHVLELEQGRIRTGAGT
ncbi:MAG TPA: ATP-binding cassette domain-containing protein [Anaerolineales bacterium]|nr:ATP-binding cassette domain-containing protein [Anaerolineales bacterium]